MNTMLDLYREIQTYKEQREDYNREERKVIRQNFKQQLKNHRNKPLEL